MLTRPSLFPQRHVLTSVVKCETFFFSGERKKSLRKEAWHRNNNTKESTHMCRKNKPSFRRGDRVVAEQTVISLNAKGGKREKVTSGMTLTVTVNPRWENKRWVFVLSNGFKFVAAFFRKVAEGIGRYCRRHRRNVYYRRAYATA